VEIDVKNNLQQYLPSVFSLLNDQKIDWVKISKKYQTELFSRMEKLSKSGEKTISVEACLFDIVSKVVQSDYSYHNLLKFIDSVFENLTDKTSDEEKSLLRDSVFHVLINTDKNYLNFVGEFAVLNNLKNAGFTLIQTEEALNDSKKGSTKVDFTVNRNNKTLLIEVVNIHFPDASELTDELIERKLTQKITDKLYNKGKQSKKVFYLVPVIWGEYKTIKMLCEFYQKSGIKFENTFTPSAFMSYTSKDDKSSKIKFGTIDTLILD
jgi:hypothetical protein